MSSAFEGVSEERLLQGLSERAKLLHAIHRLIHLCNEKMTYPSLYEVFSIAWDDLVRDFTGRDDSPEEEKKRVRGLDLVTPIEQGVGEFFGAGILGGDCAFISDVKNDKDAKVCAEDIHKFLEGKKYNDAQLGLFFLKVLEKVVNNSRRGLKLTTGQVQRAVQAMELVLPRGIVHETIFARFFHEAERLPEDVQHADLKNVSAQAARKLQEYKKRGQSPLQTTLDRLVLKYDKELGLGGEKGTIAKVQVHREVKEVIAERLFKAIRSGGDAAMAINFEGFAKEYFGKQGQPGHGDLLHQSKLFVCIILRAALDNRNLTDAQRSQVATILRRAVPMAEAGLISHETRDVLDAVEILAPRAIHADIKQERSQ